MKLNDEQMMVIKSPEKIKQVIASAGAGKTATMIELIIHAITELKEQEESILVLTFSVKAAEEIRTRLEKKSGIRNIKIKTFHAYCLYALTKYNPEFIGKNNPIIDEVVKNEWFKKKFQEKKYIFGGIPYEFIFQNQNSKKNTMFRKELDFILEEYRIYKKENFFLDFEDLVTLYLAALKKEEPWTIPARQEIKRLIVDEFQDTDMEQLEWIKMMQPGQLTVVGDDWQAIYGFRGATVKPFLSFTEIFLSAKKLYLTVNYRSTQRIIDISSIPIYKNRDKIAKKISSGSGLREGIVVKVSLEDDNKLLEIVQLINSRVLGEAIVLCRSNFRLQAYYKKNLPVERGMTIHKSKGLEFDTVFLDLCSGWNLPDEDDEKKNEFLEEERRILYVGLSRAKKNLILIGKKNQRKDRLESIFWKYFRWKVKKMTLSQLQSFLLEKKET